MTYFVMTFNSAMSRSSASNVFFTLRTILSGTGSEAAKLASDRHDEFVVFEIGAGRRKFEIF